METGVGPSKGELLSTRGSWLARRQVLSFLLFFYLKLHVSASESFLGVGDQQSSSTDLRVWRGEQMKEDSGGND